MNADDTSHAPTEHDLEEAWTPRHEQALTAWRELARASAAPADPAEDDAFFEHLTARIMAAEAAFETCAQTPTTDAMPPSAWAPPPPRRRAWLGAAAIAMCSAAAVMLVLRTDPVEHEPSVEASVAVDDSPRAQMGPRLEDAIADYLADYGRNWGEAFAFHGSIVVTKAGKTIYARSFGIADHERGHPHDLSTPFALGTLTEPLTATAILQLRDAGKLDLDDRLAAYVPEFPRADEISIRQLLRHRAGVPNYTDAPSFEVWKSREQTTPAMLEHLAEQPLEFTPGSDFSLSNGGYYLLGLVIERVSGLDYDAYLRRHVFAPAGMSSSRAARWGELRGYVWSDDERLAVAPTVHPSAFGAAGAVVSTPTELAAWTTALGSGRLLSQQSRREMFSAGAERFGYGWFIERAFDQSVAYFAGSIDGFGGSIVWLLEDDVVIHVLSNSQVLPPHRIATDVAAIVSGQEPKPREEPLEIAVEPELLQRYAGTYTLTTPTRKRVEKAVDADWLDAFEDVRIVWGGDMLYLDIRGWGVTKMHPMRKDAFFFKDHSGTTIEFETGTSGDPTRLVIRTPQTQIDLWPVD